MIRKPKEPVQAKNDWVCSCSPDKIMSHPEVMEHLKTVHKMEPPLKGKKSMIMHLDCADSFSSTYEWDINGLKLHQYTINPRQKNDPMRFGEW